MEQIEKKLSEEKSTQLKMLQKSLNHLQNQMLQVTAKILAEEDNQRKLFDSLNQKDVEYRETLNAGIKELKLTEDFKDYQFSFDGINTFTGKKVQLPQNGG